MATDMNALYNLLNKNLKPQPPLGADMVPQMGDPSEVQTAPVQDSGLTALRSILNPSNPSNAANPVGPVQGAVNQDAALSEMKHNLETQRQARPGTYVSGANPSDVTDIEQSMAESPTTGTAARKQQSDAEALHAMLTNPEQVQAANIEQSNKLAQLGAPNAAKGVADIAVEKLKAASSEKNVAAQVAGKDHVAELLHDPNTAKLPQAVMLKATNAAQAMNSLDSLEGQIADPDLQPYLGAVAGRLTDMMAGKIGTGLSSDPAINAKIGRLVSTFQNHNLQTAGVFGRSGAAPEQVIKRVEQLGSSAHDPTILHGVFQAQREMLSDIAHPKPVGQGPAPATGPGGAPAAPAPRGGAGLNWVRDATGKLVQQ